MKKPAGIAALRHKVVLCRQEDVVTAAEGFQLTRKEAATFWAAIRPMNPSTFGQSGSAIMPNRNVLTHRISVRYRPELNISLLAWIYEARRKSSPRWFKVMSVLQTEDKGCVFAVFSCRLDERGDDIAEPSNGPAMSLPMGVRL